MRQRGIFCTFFIGFWNCCDSVVFFVFFSIGFVTVATAWYFFYWFWNCCDSVVNSYKTNRKKYKKYHAVATVPKPIEKIPRCRNSSKTNRKKKKKYHAVAFLYFFYWFCNCCDSVAFFVLFLLVFGTVATAWYFLYFFYWFWNCCDSVAFFVFFLLVLELLR